MYLKKLDYEFKKGKNLNDVRRKFVEFTKGLWIQEITSEDMGSLLYHDIKEILEIEELYIDVKSKYNLFYSEQKIEKTEKMSGIIVAILIATLVFNILNFILYFKGLE